MWNILDTGPATAEENMTLDAELLESAEIPVLHLYDWISPSATYGCFIKPENFLQTSGIEKHNISLAKRPTGGGIVFHITDLAFSVIVPSSCSAYSINTLENYAFVNTIVSNVIKTFIGEPTTTPQLLPLESPAADASSRHFCMAKPTKYDVMLNGRKIGGGAQRRTKRAFLHQGTIAIAIPSDGFLHDVLLPDTAVFQAMQNNSHPLLPTTEGLEDARETLKDLLVREFLTADC